MTGENPTLKDEIAGLKTRLKNVEYERDELYNYIVDILELAWAGLQPSGMTEEQWTSYRLMKIALLASKAQAVVK